MANNSSYWVIFMLDREIFAPTQAPIRKQFLTKPVSLELCVLPFYIFNSPWSHHILDTYNNK